MSSFAMFLQIIGANEFGWYEKSGKKKRPKKEHKFYIQVMQSETFNRCNNLSFTQYSLKIILLLCFCAFCFKNPANRTRNSLFSLENLLNLSCNTRMTHCILGKLIKEFAGESPFQNNFKMFRKKIIPVK